MARGGSIFLLVCMPHKSFRICEACRLVIPTCHNSVPKRPEPVPESRSFGSADSSLLIFRSRFPPMLRLLIIFLYRACSHGISACPVSGVDAVRLARNLLIKVRPRCRRLVFWFRYWRLRRFILLRALLSRGRWSWARSHPSVHRFRHRCVCNGRGQRIPRSGSA
jgi:hypothetical protein